MEEKTKKNPWLGLKSYGVNDRIFGRDADIRALTQAVVKNRELLFFGKSGIGKSSILMAGLVGMCQQYGYLPVVLRLEHDGKVEYIEQLRQALSEEGIELRETCEKRLDHELLWEFFHRHEFWKEDERVKLLLIFDQFEEIFTLTESKSDVKAFFAELADYLNDVKPRALDECRTDESRVVESREDDLFGDVLSGITANETEDYVTDNEIHLIFTIREDFLSEFEYYGKAIPSLKQHRYLLRPLSEEQAAEVIMKPCPGMVSKEVAEVIIEKVTGIEDIELDGVPDVEVDAAVLSLYLEQLFEAKEGETISRSLVDEKGGHIIEKFYDKVAAMVPESTIEYLENELINDDGRRENRSASTIEHNIGKENLQMLISLQLLRHFRRGNDLMVEYIHDILCPIIQKRKEQREIEQKMNKRRRVMRGIAIGMSTLLALIVAWFVLTYLLGVKEYSSLYTGFVKVNGYPVGVGDELSDKDMKGRMIVYRLVRRGYLQQGNNNIRVEIIRKNPLAASGLEMPMVGEAESERDLNARSFASMLQMVDRIEYEGEDKASHEVAYDSRGKVLYAVNYYDEGQWRWACYTKANSSPLCVRNTADRIKILYDKAGYERKMLFYNASMVPQTNYVGFYGLEVTYDSENRRDTVWPLDAFGNRKSEQRWVYGANEVKVMSGEKVLYSMHHNEDGTLAQRVVYRDSKKNIVTSYEYQNGRMSGFATLSDGVTLFQFKAITDGMTTDTTIINGKGDTSFRKHTVKDSLGRVVEISFFDALSDNPIIDKGLGAHAMKTSWRVVCRGVTEKSDCYYDTAGKLMENSKGSAKDVRLLNIEDKVLQWIAYKSDGTRFKSMRYDYRDGVEYKRYAFGVDGTPIRCASWEQDNLMYYQLSLKQDAYGNFVNGIATNERGEASIFYFGNYGAESQLTLEPDYKYDSFADNVWGYANASSLSFTPPAGLRTVDYIHILSKDGAAYKAGLRDGDIIVSGNLKNGATLTVRRLGAGNNANRSVTIGSGELKAEHYQVYLTKEEYENL